MGIADRAIAILRMKEVADTFKSVERLKTWVREQGLGYRNVLLHRDASNAFYRARAETIQGGLNLDAPLAKREYLKGSWQRPEAYKIVAEATWYDPVNDRYQTRYFTAFSDRDMSTSEILDTWQGQHEQYMAEQTMILTGLRVVEKWHRIGALT